MTNEEAKKWLERFELAFPLPIEDYIEAKEALDIAVKALEQQPILDKIRVEIENDWQFKKYPSSPFSCGLRRALEIIDKYRAESEEE